MFYILFFIFCVYWCPKRFMYHMLSVSPMPLVDHGMVTLPDHLIALFLSLMDYSNFEYFMSNVSCWAPIFFTGLQKL